MNRSTLLAASLVVAALPLGATDTAETPAPMMRFHAEVDVDSTASLLQPVAAGQAVRVRFPVGELDIKADNVSEVRTELATSCRKLSERLCEKYRRKLRLEGEVIDNVVEVRLVGLPKWKLRKLELDGTVTVPRWAPLAVRVGIGDVDIFSGDRDLSVRMGIGDLTVTAPRSAVGSVIAATGIGDAGLRESDQTSSTRHHLLGARVNWHDGPGTANIAVGLRIGDAQVVLE